MLSIFDDYPIHQTPEPIARPASSDRNVYDRYWMNGYASDGEFYFGVAMGRYPHRKVQDAAFSIARAGEQHALHASRRAPAEPAETVVGPMRIEIAKPMAVTRVIIEPNETGIACDLTFRARTACIEEGRQTLLADDRPVMDSTRFTQFGRWEGTIEYAGQTLRVEPGRVRGTKDRSWGLRRVGEPDPGAPPVEAPHVFFLWAPIHFEDLCTHFCVFEKADGFRWHESGAIVPAYASVDELPGVQDPAQRSFHRTDWKLRYVPGTRRAAEAEIALIGQDGTRHEIHLEPLLTFQMKGLGYVHPTWGHGVWKGEQALAGDSWKADEIDPLLPENLHIQQVMRARYGDREGVGVLEQLAIGPHAPSGFEGYLDGAK